MAWPAWTIGLVLTMSIAGCARTTDIPGGIAELDPVDLGGLRQWIQIRGEDTGNPLLLWLHGGPGAAQMAIAPRFNAALESDFIVVHWDQRGAGKSNRSDFDPATMTFEQFVADVRELTRYLRGRFGDRPLILLGHSWGTQLGLTVAARYPEDYQAYIGVAQVIGRAHSQPVAHAWLRARIEAQGDHRDLATLDGLGPPPVSGHADYVRFAHLLGKYGGNMDVPFSRLAAAALQAPEYTLLDYWRWWSGARRGSGPMWHEPAYANFDAYRTAPALGLPAFFISGANDYNTPAVVTQAYYEVLEAPAGKAHFVIADAAHMPFLADPTGFAALLREIRQAVLADQSSGGRSR